MGGAIVLQLLARSELADLALSERIGLALSERIRLARLVPYARAMDDPGAAAEQPRPTGPTQGPHRSGRSSLQDGAVRGALWTLLHVLISVPLAFVANIVVARVLGTVDYGWLAVLSSVQGVALMVLGLGSGSALVQFGSKWYAAGRDDEVDALVSRVQGLQLLFTLPTMVIVVLLLVHLDPWLMVIALAFGVVVPTAFGVALDCLLIENRSASAARLALVVGVLTQVLVVIVVLTLRRAEAVWAVRLALGGVVVLGALAIVTQRHRRAITHPRLPREMPPGFWRFGLLAMVAALVSSLVMSRTEIFVLEWLGTPEAVGIFSLAFGLTVHLFAPAQALINPLTPAVSALHEVESPDVVRNAFTRTIRAASTISGVVVATFVPFFGLLVPVIYQQQFAAAGPVVIALGSVSALTLLSGPATAFVLARLSAGRRLQANLVALVVDVVLAVALIPLWGLWGAVVANLAGALLLTWLMLGLERRSLDMPYAELARCALPTVLGGLACVGGAVLGAMLASPVLGALLALALGSVAYVVLVRATRSGLTDGDAEAILNALPARLQRMAGGLVRPLVSAAG